MTTTSMTKCDLVNEGGVFQIKSDGTVVRTIRMITNESADTYEARALKEFYDYAKGERDSRRGSMDRVVVASKYIRIHLTP